MSNLAVVHKNRSQIGFFLGGGGGPKNTFLSLDLFWTYFFGTPQNLSVKVLIRRTLPTVSNKAAPVSKRTSIVSKKAPIVGRKLPIASKKATSIFWATSMFGGF